MVEVTTVIPVYNGERYLPATLESLAAQTRPPNRVVVLDNQSTDSTPEIVRNFRSLRCEWVRNESNLGAIGNLNRCLQFSAQTRFLHILTADDLILPEFFARVLPPLETVRGRAMAYSRTQFVDQDLRPIWSHTASTNEAPIEVPLRKFLVPQSEMQTVILPGVVFRTDGEATPCEFQNLPQVADGLFLADWARFAQRIFEIPQALCQYRVHPFSTSSLQKFNVQYWALDEWRLMRTILHWIPEPPARRWLRSLWLRWLFAARTEVKIDMMRRLHPALIPDLRKARRECVGPLFATLGAVASQARDSLRKLRRLPSRADEILSHTSASHPS